MRLNSRAFLESPPNEPPRIKLEWLDGETGGLIALTGGPGGPIDAAFAAGQSHLAGTRSSICSACSASGSTSNCSATACRGAPRRAVADRSRL